MEIEEKSGFITIHRKILKNPICKKPHWAWLWVYLIMRANYEDTSIIWNGKVEKIKRGSFVTGRNSLAKETGIPASTIEDVLKYLETQQQIRQQKNSKYRVITIVNYDKYQKPDRKTDKRATAERQQSDTDNESNNLNKDNKGESTPAQESQSFFECGEAYNRLLEDFSKGRDRPKIEKEFKKFILYWTEKNRSGTRERWQQQGTFEVKRRLYSWLSRSNDFGEKITKKTTNVLFS